MRRREVITLICGAATAWPVVGHAQQRVMPLVGVLCAGTAQALERYLASFREGMRRLGYVEGSNVRFEFRFADCACRGIFRPKPFGASFPSDARRHAWTVPVGAMLAPVGPPDPVKTWARSAESRL